MYLPMQPNVSAADCNPNIETKNSRVGHFVGVDGYFPSPHCDGRLLGSNRQKHAHHDRQYGSARRPTVSMQCRQSIEQPS